MNFGTTKMRPTTNATSIYSNSDRRAMNSEKTSGVRDRAQEDFSQEALEALIFEQEGSDDKTKNKPMRRNAWGYCSYAQMIAYAIITSEQKRLTLNEIYEWMIENFAYFRERSDKDLSKGWKNSIRHNLSLRGRFKRINNDSPGKSSYWTVCTEERTKKKKHSKKAKKNADDVHDSRNTQVTPHIYQIDMSNSQQQMNNNNINQWGNYMNEQQQRQHFLEKQQLLQEKLFLLEREQQMLPQPQIFNSLGQAQMGHRAVSQEAVSMNVATSAALRGDYNYHRINFEFMDPTRDMTIGDVLVLNKLLGVSYTDSESSPLPPSIERDEAFLDEFDKALDEYMPECFPASEESQLLTE